MDNWHILETHFDPKNPRSPETIFTIGNGYLGTRGTFEESYPADQPATLINGFFDDVPIVYSELANTPNWLDLQILTGEQRFNLKDAKVKDYQRDLDLHNGELTRTLTWQLPSGSRLALEFRRFTSLADEHVAALRCTIRSLDFDGDLEFQAGLPGMADNEGFLHLEWKNQGVIDEESAFLQVTTRSTRTDLAEAFNFRLVQGDEIESGFCDSRLYPARILRVHLEPGAEAIVEKLVTIYTSLDVHNPRQAAVNKLATAAKAGYQALLAKSTAAWQKEWNASDITIEGDDEADQAVRYAIFQMLIAAPRKNEHVSIPAKSLSGFGYHGHVFWDTEIFILPFFTYTQPQIARRLLMYRYHTLPAARRKALQNHYEGAQFAWESAATGDENTPRWVPLPSGDLVRIWCGDIEHHITSDVAFAIQRYWQVSGDDVFMQDYGAEIVLEAARFWNSRAEWDEPRQCYNINDVIGPDEYHDHVNNSVYTNALARWTLKFGLEVLAWLKKDAPAKARQLEKDLALHPKKLEHWQHVIDHLFLGFDPRTGLFEQFEGFFERERIDLQTFEPRTQSMQALLGIEKTQTYQILKQPDIIMLLYLLGKAYGADVIKKNFDYYTPVTDLSYGSSLGPPIQSIMAAHIGDMKAAYDLFKLAACTDLGNVRGNSADGIHVATDGGLWQSVVFGFGGLDSDTDGPSANPNLPPQWKRLRFNVIIKGKKYTFDLRPGDKLTRRPALPLQGVIFDLDGVLTDTSELHYRAWKRLADEEGLPFTRKDNEALRGISRRDSLLVILKNRRINEARMQTLMERKNRYYLESVAALTPHDLLPGARELLDSLRAAGIKICIGSASKNARAVIEKLELANLLDQVADGSSVSRQKPAPDLFLHAARQLGIPASQCAVFEDAAAGIQAAKAGGMWAIGVGPRQRLDGAHVIYPSLKGLTAKKIIAQLSQLMQSEAV
ncbi:MAG TPA: beta-phosphoglucomutase [Longilinea sp.]|nr:beta-phosphoglucomutase [Longilinea sp.]